MYTNPQAIPSTGGAACITFSDVSVYPRARKLCVRGEPVELSDFAFEILLTLIEADGKLVSKRDLFRRLWPTTCGSESNLRVHMCKLRRALGDSAATIRTAPNRGYWLTAPLNVGVEVGSDPNAGAAVMVIDDDATTRQALNALLRSLRTQLENHPALSDSTTVSLSSGVDHIVVKLSPGACS